MLVLRVRVGAQKKSYMYKNTFFAYYMFCCCVWTSILVLVVVCAFAVYVGLAAE